MMVRLIPFAFRGTPLQFFLAQYVTFFQLLSNFGESSLSSSDWETLNAAAKPDEEMVSRNFLLQKVLACTNQRLCPSARRHGGP